MEDRLDKQQWSRVSKWSLIRNILIKERKKKKTTHQLTLRKDTEIYKISKKDPFQAIRCKQLNPELRI